MSSSRRFKFSTIFWIVLAFTMFFVVIGIIGVYVTPGSNDEKIEKLCSTRNILSQLGSFAFFVIYYFVSVNLFYRYIAEKKRVLDFAKPVAISFLMLAIYYVFNFSFMWNTMEVSVEGKVKEQLTAGLMVFIFSLSSIFITAFSFVLAYLTNLRDEKKQRKILEEQKMQLEIEKSQANFNFLKSQINPHFLHNTLNFLYAKSLPLSAELSEGILTLSDIMRYALGQDNTTDGKALLKDEIEHVRNVIKINQLRYSNVLNVQFDVEGVVNGATIIPFVLITLVENAFKHGDIKNSQHPIEVRLKIDSGVLYFYCRNRKKTGPKELSTGIGLDNIKKRLELAYGTDYRFEVKEDAEFYTTELTISKL
jgi:two-component system, LytTR family, sensor kinase